jgi:hypothetical protein
MINAMLNRGQTPEDLLYQMRSLIKKKKTCLNLEKTKKRQLALQLATLTRQDKTILNGRTCSFMAKVLS